MGPGSAARQAKRLAARRPGHATTSKIISLAMSVPQNPDRLVDERRLVTGPN
jgi:hypothetical protein